jgi:hypothetical protein
MASKVLAVPPAESRIRTLRGQAVLLDADIAALYGVATRVLIQAVRRNRARFPPDFMFQLSNQELTNLRSQSVISSFGSFYGGRRYLPYAFTEQGVAMLSSVLRSSAAMVVNIEIMRAFVRLRRASVVSQQLINVVNELAKRVDIHDSAIKDLIETISRLVAAPTGKKRPIGFTAEWRGDPK